VQVPMQGRGAVPEPELVNHLFWLFLNYTLEFPDKYIVMHCTHGFNRTGEATGIHVPADRMLAHKQWARFYHIPAVQNAGYVLVSLMLRMEPRLSVADAVTTFAKLRPPGIYKEDYVQSLFDYYHERR
jgi:mRNA-capping enzyme